MFGGFLGLLWSIPPVPSAPITIKGTALPNPVPAGAVIEIVGTYATPQTSPRRLVLNGTKDQPIVIRNGSRTDPARITASWEVTGSYFTIEGLAFQPGAGLVVVAPTVGVRLKNLELAGDGQTCHGVAFVSYDTADVNTEWSLTGSYIHDQGDVAATYDQDCHGLTIAARNTKGWIQDNEFARNSGDGIQINGGPGGQLTTTDLYAEGNRSHDNKQTGFWVKQAARVVWLRNEAYNHRAGNSSLGQCAGQQYAPEDVFWIENHFHHCDRGWLAASDAGVPTDGLRVFVLSNDIHDIRSANPGEKSDPWQPCGISMQGSKTRYVFRNTVRDSDCGFGANNNVGQQTLTRLNRVLNTARPTVGPMTEVTQAIEDRVRAFYEERVR